MKKPVTSAVMNLQEYVTNHTCFSPTHKQIPIQHRFRFDPLGNRCWFEPLGKINIRIGIDGLGSRPNCTTVVLNHFASNSKCHELGQEVEKMEQIAIVNISYHTYLLCTDRKHTV